METAGYRVGASFATRALWQTRSLYAAEDCARPSSRTWSTSTAIESFPHSGYQTTLCSESRCKADKVPGLLVPREQGVRLFSWAIGWQTEVPWRN
jgi:hypothetical protein